MLKLAYDHQILFQQNKGFEIGVNVETAWQTFEDFISDLRDQKSGLDRALIRSCRRLTAAAIRRNRYTKLKCGCSLEEKLLQIGPPFPSIEHFCEENVIKMGVRAHSCYVELGLLPDLLNCANHVFTISAEGVLEEFFDKDSGSMRTGSKAAGILELHLLISPDRCYLLYPLSPLADSAESSPLEYSVEQPQPQPQMQLHQECQPQIRPEAMGEIAASAPAQTVFFQAAVKNLIIHHPAVSTAPTYVVDESSQSTTPNFKSVTAAKPEMVETFANHEHSLNQPESELNGENSHQNAVSIIMPSPRLYHRLSGPEYYTKCLRYQYLISSSSSSKWTIYIVFSTSAQLGHTVLNSALPFLRLLAAESTDSRTSSHGMTEIGMGVSMKQSFRSSWRTC